MRQYIKQLKDFLEAYGDVTHPEKKGYGKSKRRKKEAKKLRRKKGKKEIEIPEGTRISAAAMDLIRDNQIRISYVSSQATVRESTPGSEEALTGKRKFQDSVQECFFILPIPVMGMTYPHLHGDGMFHRMT